MEVISIRTAQERRVLALKTFNDIQARKRQKKRIEGEILGMMKQHNTKYLREKVQGRKY